MAEARGFSQQPNGTYPALGSFTKVPTEPDVHFTLSASEYVIRGIHKSDSVQRVAR